MVEADLKAFLDALTTQTRQLGTALRAVVRRTAPGAEESLLWGGLSYHRPQVGGRVKEAVCQIVVKWDKVSGLTSSTASAWRTLVVCCKAIGCPSGLCLSGLWRTPSGRKSQP
jgi:hypothetical protein